MRKKLLLIALAVLGVLASFGAVAPGASAAIERCSGGVYGGGGVTLYTCIYVDSDNGRAQVQLFFDSSVSEKSLPVTVTINRSGGSATKTCRIDWVRGDPQPAICNAFAGNPAGTQSWRADGDDGFGAASSPMIFDT